MFAALEMLSRLLIVFSVAAFLYHNLSHYLRQQRSYALFPYPTDALLEADSSHDHDSSAVRDRARAMLVGLALGDALGMPRENLPVKLADLRYGPAPTLAPGILRWMRRAGTVSDDTQLTLALARALGSDGQLDQDRYLRELVDWYPARIGPGRATIGALRRLKKRLAGRDERAASSGDPSSQGNGASMRVLPLALLDPVLEEDDWLALIAASARPTHRAAEAIAGAEVIARAARALLQLQPPGPGEAIDPERARILLEDCEPSAHSQALEDWRARFALILEKLGRGDRQIGELGSSGWVFESVPASLFVALRYPSSPERGLRACFEAGKDVDTIAALYLAMVGAMGGMASLQTLPWRQVQGVEELLDAADRLCPPGPLP